MLSRRAKLLAVVSRARNHVVLAPVGASAAPLAAPRRTTTIVAASAPPVALRTMGVISSPTHPLSSARRPPRHHNPLSHSSRHEPRRFFHAGVTLGLPDEQKSIIDTAAKFAASHWEPHAARWDAEKIFPVDALRAAAQLGFGAIYCREDHGGSAMSRLDASLIFEQLSGACPSTTAFLSIHNMCAWMVDSFASEQLRCELLPQLATMEKIASYCLTEPSSGSDAASLRTTARDGGDHFVVNGAKAFISGAGASDVYLVMCRTGDETARGISCLAIDKTLAGVSFGKNEKKLGWNSQPTRIVQLDNVKVPKSRLLGRVGEGFKIAMKGLDGGRVNIATCSLGSAQRCLDASIDYTKTRKQFGASIGSFQNTQFKLAEMATKVHSSRLLIRQAAAAMDAADPDATVYCAMAKMKATEECYEVVDQALQLHGGYGYLGDYPIERHMRDLRVHRILEGTNEVMRVIIARQLQK